MQYYPEFPPLQWLGHGIDLTTVTPFDVTVLSKCVKKLRQVIEVDPDANTRIVEIDGVRYKVPRMVTVAQDIRNLEGAYITYGSGPDASASFQADRTLSVRYLGLSGGDSVVPALHKSFRADQQFAFYSFNSLQFASGLRNYIDYLNEKAIKRFLEEIETPFPENPTQEVLQQYQDFFRSIGSHVITNTSYGARFQLCVWSPNTVPEVNDRFSVSVQARLNGVMTQGEYDPAVKKEDQYKSFLEFVQRTASVRGGDPALAAKLLEDPSNYDTYVEWTYTTLTSPDVMSYQTTEIWNLMREAASGEIRRRANDIQDAYEYIINNPQTYTTQAVFMFDANEAEFGLLTPSAKIVPSLDMQVPEGTAISTTKISWGAIKDVHSKHLSIQFYIVNDGSPVDFYLAHRSRPTYNGSATLTMDREKYVNGQVTENKWSTVFFYQAHVSRKSQTRYAPEPEPKPEPKPTPGASAIIPL